ncbi:heme o synthase [Bacillus sp. B15-48]|uniref:heme o synthase n=1 Tax=Bacillus sp. B15-48 TaxID=1548601 RepID=UPI0019400B23|nr:heme o synthase [Bacillus sp. B15-48]MBM4760970.1 protoheme IX farnesyltransferase [Bacillus sp. B15-48]
MILPQQETGKTSVQTRQRVFNLLADLKSLFKAVVLFSNVLPVITGLALALYFTNTSLVEVWSVALLTVVGSTMVMAGALILNNWYDVDIDSVMARTKSRPTVTGTISLKVVLAMGIAFTMSGFILLLFTSVEAVGYAFVGWFTYVVLYTMWSKRRYTFNTIIGSVSGAVPPLIGWAAIDSTLHIVPMVLFLILFIWQMPHTYAIAIKKHDEYKAAGVAMLPVIRGVKTTKWHMLFYICCLLPLPFFLSTLGISFLILATLMNFGWFLLSVSGFRTKDDYNWAHWNFLYSVNYITFLFFFMIIVTFFGK